MFRVWTWVLCSMVVYLHSTCMHVCEYVLCLHTCIIIIQVCRHSTYAHTCIPALHNNYYLVPHGHPPTYFANGHQRTWYICLYLPWHHFWRGSESGWGWGEPFSPKHLSLPFEGQALAASCTWCSLPDNDWGKWNLAAVTCGSVHSLPWCV